MSRSLHTAVMLDWNIPPEQSELLEKYYLLHWSGEYFMEQYRHGYGRLHHQGTNYSILFYSGMTRECMNAPDVAISFRKMKLFPYGYAMIRSLESS